MDDRLNPRLARRHLLLALAAGAGVAAATSVAAFSSASADTFKENQKTKPRYRETADVKAFYKVNRY